MAEALEPGLYIVATPIGNLGDLTVRAARTLAGCHAVACEDTRVTARLLQHLQITKPLWRYDDHSGEDARNRLIEAMRTQAIALVSDAGTPLISDPGYRLVRAARESGVGVFTLPGPSAVVAALTLAGLPTDRFLFAGFLPAKDKARRDTMAELAPVRATLVFYETAPRLLASLQAIGEALPGREVAVARELTKAFEECRTGMADELIGHFTAKPARGEIVLVVAPPADRPPELPQDEVDALLRAALAQAKPSQAAAQVAREHRLDRKTLYGRALQLRDDDGR